MRLKFTKSGLAFLSVLFVIAFLSNSVFATDGYFSNGQGTRNKGMAGAGIAFLNSPFSGSINPAGLGFQEKKWSFEVSLGVFNPNRQYSVIGAPTTPDKWGYIDANGNFVNDPRYSAFGLTEGTVESGSTTFVIPAIAFTYKLGEKNFLGLNFYGNGGMNTDYDAKTYYSEIVDSFGNPMPDGNPNPMANVVAPTGVNLQQMFLSLTYAPNLKPSINSPWYPILKPKPEEVLTPLLVTYILRSTSIPGIPAAPMSRNACIPFTSID